MRILTVERWPFKRIRPFIRSVAGRSGNATLEFAVIMIPFIGLLLFVLEISYDVFTQEVMDRALYLATRQIQTGSAQNSLSGTDFITKYMKPHLTGLLSVSNVYLKVQKISPGVGQDYYDFTLGSLPTTNGSLNLTGFSSNRFCNAAPGQLLLISTIYVGPAITSGLFPSSLTTYLNGSPVHATLSTIGLVSEAFNAAVPVTGSAAICS